MTRNTISAVLFPLLLIILLSSIAPSAWGFITTAPQHLLLTSPSSSPSLHAAAAGTTAKYTSAEGSDPKEIIARKIIVCGDVDGGYYRSCVKNEGSRFRQLCGTMSPPDDSKKAEILVEVSSHYLLSLLFVCLFGRVLDRARGGHWEEGEEEDLCGHYLFLYGPLESLYIITEY